VHPFDKKKKSKIFSEVTVIPSIKVKKKMKLKNETR